MNEIVAYQEQRQLTAFDIRSQVNLVQEVMQAVMKKDTHYGTIPGTPKPTLYKPGAEVLAATFRIAVSYKIEDLSTPDVARYRITSIGTHQTSGIVMGEGMGECSSGEEKYKWRKAYDEEFNATAEDKKRIKYGKYTAKQVRTEPADLANTILKMACKRAQVAMILNVTAASDIFTQDIEDLPEELRPSENEGRQPEGKPDPVVMTDEGLMKMCADRVDKEGVTTKMGAKSQIQSGDKTAKDLIDFLSAKYTMPQAIIDKINSWTPKGDQQ